MPRSPYTETVTVRLTPAEKAELVKDAKAQGLTMSAYIRKLMGLANEVQGDVPTEADRESSGY
jgi:predicted HicB family RNase H-like nuclease